MKRNIKTAEMAKIARNHAGNAALCAILIMIMLLAIGTAALVVTGRQGIEEKKNMPANAFAVSSIEDVSSETTSSEPEPPKALMEYPQKDFEFMKMELDGITSKYCVLLDCGENRIYTAKNYTKKAYPASLTKIMTVIIALENCDDLQDIYKFTAADIKSLKDENASVAGFEKGEKVTIEDLLYGAMLPSGADATLGIANYIAGSEEEFVRLMNAKVEELGLTGTHFTNASGLHDEDHYSTAMDIAMIIEYAVNNPDISEQFLKICAADSYTTTKSNKHDSGIELTSIFLSRYDGFYIDRDQDEKPDADIIGGKTGFTNESGYSLASIYKIEDTYYVCVTLKSEDSEKATTDNVAITERYLPTYDLIEDISKNDSSSGQTDSSSVVDATPKPIDQTDSNETVSSSQTDDTSTSSSYTNDDEVPM